jgi:hypothetical protein
LDPQQVILIMNNRQANGNWQRVSRARPCPICKKPDWCLLAADGSKAICMRIEPGSYRTKKDRQGKHLYFHQLAEARAAAPLRPRPPGQQPRGAGSDTLHAVYSVLLANLRLSEPHRANLRSRGLADDVIDRNAYRTLPAQSRAKIAKRLHERFGNLLHQVPGFIIRDKGRGPYLTIAGCAGILIPCRDTQARIVALKVRGDEDGDPRYSYLTSTRHQGPSPGAPVHVPLGVKGPCPLVQVTEGELKADVSSALASPPTIAIPGAATWKPVLATLKALQATTVRLAFDMDARQNPHVARALAACAQGLKAEGYPIELARWPEAQNGIDELLAAGKKPEVLQGAAAWAAIEDIRVTGVSADSPTAALERLHAVFREGGAAGIFRDKALLAALARLQADNPAEYDARKAELKDWGVSPQQLEYAVRPLLREQAAKRPPMLEVTEYLVANGCLCWRKHTADGPQVRPLCNFTARIAEQITKDDGAERTINLAVEGQLADGRPLPRAEISAAEFGAMNWTLAAWGTRAVIDAGFMTKDRLRVALQTLSGDVPERVVYLHTRWRKIGERWVYLHAGGGIGLDDPITGIAVELPDALARFELPSPPKGRDLINAVRASLRLLDGLAPDPITFPQFAAIYRAVLGESDFSTHVVGKSGIYKSELATLCQQHFGPRLDARHLPGNWSSTENALEEVAFRAKDTLLVVDDFKPRGSPAEIASYHRKADRLFRAQGNHAGRQRLWRDGSLRPDKRPRGLILSTGEEIPEGEALQARLLILECSPKDIAKDKLTACQADAAAGLPAQALAGFVG